MSAHEIDDFEQNHLSQTDAVDLRSVVSFPVLTRYDRTRSHATICDGDLSQSNEIIKQLAGSPFSQGAEPTYTTAWKCPSHAGGCGP